MAYAPQQLINGVSLGMIYGLVAVFLSLIALLGLSALGITSVPLAHALTLLFAAGIAAQYGWTVERVACRPLRGSFRLVPLISAIGMSITLQNFVRASPGALPGGDMDVREGEIVTRIGASRACKFTLMMTISGSLRTMAGSAAELLARPDIRAAYLKGGHV